MLVCLDTAGSSTEWLAPFVVFCPALRCFTQLYLPQNQCVHHVCSSKHRYMCCGEAAGCWTCLPGKGFMMLWFKPSACKTTSCFTRNPAQLPGPGSYLNSAFCRSYLLHLFNAEELCFRDQQPEQEPPNSSEATEHEEQTVLGSTLHTSQGHGLCAVNAAYITAETYPMKAYQGKGKQEQV